ncbi:hypothetical protein CXB51_001923 [Gossypium anomalum]|uniref:DUF4283 domain-containing protein n=1 Tax=Gossypium anomalum TaxID=47600 RepID=A0A8J5ZS06_9ROSI|nr:hypothetical protein CXB51_001923 [Gossypium anomalum]
MDANLANLRLLDEEEEAFQEDSALVDQNHQFCLVGRCLTNSVVNFPSLHNTMADLWHPIGGICITDLGVLKREDPSTILLNFTEFWVQVHDLLAWLMFETMAKQFGDFWGKFLEYDSAIPTLGFQKFMRIRVCLDVYVPLKLTRRRGTVVGRWLRRADGSQLSSENIERNFQGSCEVEGKKRQRKVEGSFTGTGNTGEVGSFDLTASSGNQSSQMQ